MCVTVEDKTKLKGQGFIPQRDGEHFACRVVVSNGCFTAVEMQKISEIAEKYGRGYVANTVRLSVEIPWIKYRDIKAVKKALTEAGLYCGGTGARVRPIVACKGTYCSFGLVDTHELAKEIHQKFYVRFYDEKLPHKFKIAIGGCPNNCVKPDLNDISIVGQNVVAINDDLCRGCVNCNVILSCRMDALKIVEGKIKIDRDKCNNCGICAMDKCNFGAITCKKKGFKVLIGGKWGKVGRRGTPIHGIFSKEQAIDIIERAILFYKDNGKTKERFGDMIDRIGFNEVKDRLLKV